jgi:hypothetical protein
MLGEQMEKSAGEMPTQGPKPSQLPSKLDLTPKPETEPIFEGLTPEPASPPVGTAPEQAAAAEPTTKSYPGARKARRTDA